MTAKAVTKPIHNRDLGEGQTAVPPCPYTRLTKTAELGAVSPRAPIADPRSPCRASRFHAFSASRISRRGLTASSERKMTASMDGHSRQSRHSSRQSAPIVGVIVGASLVLRPNIKLNQMVMEAPWRTATGDDENYVYAVAL
jgi:hypothetical protein